MSVKILIWKNASAEAKGPEEHPKLFYFTYINAKLC